MRTPRLPALLFAGLLALGACGDTGKAGSTVGGGSATLEVESVETALASLVPANTDLLVYVPSTQALIDKIRGLAAVFGEDVAQQVDPDAMIAEGAGPLAEYLDRARPLAIALALPPDGNGDPMPTAILPVTDVDAALKVLEEQGLEAPTSRGEYVLLPLAGPASKPSETAPPIAQKVPQGDLVVRADLAGMIEIYGDQLRGGLDEGMDAVKKQAPPGGPDLSSMFGGMEQRVRDLIDSAEYLDLSLDIDDTTVHLKALFTMKEGSKLASTPAPSAALATMGGMLPDGFPVTALVTYDMEKMLDWVQPMLDTMVESMPEEAREDFRGQWKKVRGLYDHVGDDMAVAFRLDQYGMVMAGIMDLEDPDAYFEAWNALLDEQGYAKTMADMGISMNRLPTSKVAGYDVEHFEVTFDTEKMMAMNPAMEGAPPEAAAAADQMFKAMFGGGGMTMHAAEVDGRLVSVLGGDEALLEQTIRRASGAARPAEGVLATAIAQAGGRPTFLLHVEGRSLLRGAMGVARAMMPPEQTADLPEIPDGKPLDLVVYATGGGRYYAGGLSIDIGAMKDLVEVFQNAMR